MPQNVLKAHFRRISDFGLTTKNLRGLVKFSPFFADWSRKTRKKGLKRACFDPFFREISLQSAKKRPEISAYVLCFKSRIQRSKSQFLSSFVIER